MRNLFLATFVLLASLFSAPAWAYEYVYTSNVFQITVDNTTSGVNTYNVFLTATIDTQSLLTAGSALTPGMTIKIDQHSAGPNAPEEHLIDPWPSANPSLPVGSVYNPYIVPTFSISAVDADGLPTVWSVGLHMSLNLPTGRFYDSSLQTSNAGESVELSYLGFTHNYGGSGGSNPGTWTLAVPEPETYAMLLAGLALIGGVRRYKTSA